MVSADNRDRTPQEKTENWTLLLRYLSMDRGLKMNTGRGKHASSEPGLDRNRFNHGMKWLNTQELQHSIGLNVRVFEGGMQNSCTAAPCLFLVGAARGAQGSQLAQLSMDTSPSRGIVVSKQEDSDG